MWYNTLMGKRVHTFEACVEVAKSYPTISALTVGNRKVAAAIRANGWLDDIYPDRVKATADDEWPRERIAEVAKQYRTRHEMRSSEHRYAANKAIRKGWFDCLPPNARPTVVRAGTWTEEACKKDALRFSTKAAWQTQSNSAYNAAKRLGVREQCCEHMTPQHETWTKEACFKSAELFNGREEWKRNSNAYQAALRNGWLEECCAHMESTRLKSDSVYLWKAEGLVFNGMPVYKVGVTTAALGRKRIAEVARKARSKAELIFNAQVQDARKVEAQLLALGQNPLYEGFTGCTEFRAFNATEIQKAKQILEKSREEML